MVKDCEICGGRQKIIFSLPLKFDKLVSLDDWLKNNEKSRGVTIFDSEVPKRITVEEIKTIELLQCSQCKDVTSNV